MARLIDSKIAAIKPPETGQAEIADDLVTGLRIRVGTSGRKTWIVRSRVGRKLINKTLGTYPLMKVADARAAAKAHLISLATDGLPKPKHTFATLVDTWIERQAKPNNRSWRSQKRRLELHVLPHWRDHYVNEITRADVIDLIERVSDQGGEVLPNRVLTLVKTLFRYALGRDWLESSPAEAVRRPTEEAPRDRFLTEAEIKRVWQSADLIGYPFGGFIKMLLLSAQRRTEVATMQWADVDLDRGEWIIPADRTKSERSHLVPLSPLAVALLAELPRLGEFVFTTDGRAAISGFSKSKARLDRYIAKSGDSVALWRLHDLRRTAATGMGRLGVADSVIARVLNHAPSGLTNRVYNLYAASEEKRAALNAWSAELNTITAVSPRRFAA